MKHLAAIVLSLALAGCYVEKPRPAPAPPTHARWVCLCSHDDAHHNMLSDYDRQHSARNGYCLEPDCDCQDFVVWFELAK